MTRFKELQRIEAALETGVPSELQWAIDYCEMRIRIAPLTAQKAERHEKTWKDLLAKVRRRISSSK